MSRRDICISTADGEIGYIITRLLLKNMLTWRINSITGLVMHPASHKSIELATLGAKVIQHVPGRERDVVEQLKKAYCDTICLVPPSHRDKLDILLELANAAKKAGIHNVLLISSVGCEFADPQRQPRLREYLDIETAVLASQGDPRHSPCVIRTGLYTEHLLMHLDQVKIERMLPLPIGDNHKLAPVAVGDIALFVAHVLVGRSEQGGFDDRQRGQLMVVTGPVLCSGADLTEAMSEALGDTKLKFSQISEREAKREFSSLLLCYYGEKEDLLEYYSLVREEKTNYISTTAFRDAMRRNPTTPVDVFKSHVALFGGEKKIKTETLD